jgi:hypothetical protein
MDTRYQERTLFNFHELPIWVIEKCTDITKLHFLCKSADYNHLKTLFLKSLNKTNISENHTNF